MTPSLHPLIQPIASTISPTSSMQDAIALMAQQALDVVWVRQEDKVEGFLTERNVVCACAKGIELAHTPVQWVMRSPPIFVPADATAAQVYQVMQAQQVTQVVVVDDTDQPLGTVSQDSILQTLNPMMTGHDTETSRPSTQAPLQDPLAQQNQEIEPLQRQGSDTKFDAELLNAIPLAICISTVEEGRFVFTNQPFCQMVGYTPDEMQNRTSDELGLWLEPIDRSDLVAVIQDQSMISIEAQLETKSKQVKIISLSVSSISIGGENYLLTVMRDIKGLKLIEEALWSSEARARAILTAIPDLMLLADRNGKYLEIIRQSDSLYNLLDQLPEAVNPFGQSAVDIMSEDVATRQMNAIAQAIATGNVQSYKQRLWVRGKVQHEDVRVSPIDDDTVLLIIRDITDREQAVIDLLRSQQRYKRATAAAGVGVWEWDVITNDMYIDPMLKAMLGYRDDEIKNHFDHWGNYVYEGDRPTVADAIERCLSNETSVFRVEHRMCHRDGTLRWVLAQGQVIHDVSGRVVRLVGTDNDISELKRLELSLRSSESKLNDVLDSIGASVGYFRCYPDGTWYADYHSKGSETIFGYIPEEFTADIWFSGIVTDNWPELQRTITAAVEASNPLTIEYCFRRKDGALRWIEDTLTSHWSETDQCWHVTAVGTDVSDRKRIEFSLKESEKQFRAVFNSAFQFMGLFTPEGSYIDINDTALQFCGCSRSELLETPLWESPRVAPFPDTVAKIRMAIATAAQGELMRVEIQAQGQDGAVIDVDVSFKPLLDLQGRCYQILMEGRDITERKRTAIGLEHQRNFLQQVINAVPSGLYVKDSEGRYLIANQATADIYGLPAADILGKRDIDVGSDLNQWIQFQENNRHVMTQRQSQINADELIYNHRGEGHWYQTMICPFVNLEGDVQGIIGTSIDIDDRKEAEAELRRSLDEKSVLVAEIHHRVKNNLQVIDSLLNLQAMRIEDTAARTALTNSGNRIRAMALVHEKLYQTEIGEGICLDSYLQELICTIVRSIELDETSVSLSYELDPSIVLTLDQAIPCGLVFNEMLTNAIKYGVSDHLGSMLEMQRFETPKAAIAIRLTQTKTFGKHTVYLEVGNSGDTLPSGFSLGQSHRTMGIQLMQVLASQLDGAITCERGEMTWFCLSFEHEAT